MQVQFLSSFSWLLCIIGPVSVCVEGIDQLHIYLHREYDIRANTNLRIYIHWNIEIPVKQRKYSFAEKSGFLHVFISCPMCTNEVIHNTSLAELQNVKDMADILRSGVYFLML